MKAQVIKIGNSKGIRIPKPLLEECQLSEDVELKIHPDGLLICPAKTPRRHWNDAFKQMADDEQDELLVSDSEVQTSFEKEEWQW